MDLDLIQDRLARLRRRCLRPTPGRGQAAVLMPLVERPSGLHLLFTLRTMTVATHKGQVSFPGGYRDGDESLRRTALRETEEEIGVGESNVRLLGGFHDYVTGSGAAVVHPFVGTLQGRWTLNPNPQEVERVFEVPLAFFGDSPPRAETYRQGRRKVPVYHWDVGKDLIWGLTAAMIKDFLDLLEICRW